jgi:hypothetical protein
MASVAKGQAAARRRDRALIDIGKLGRSRAVDFELGKTRAGARTTRVKGPDRKYCARVGK